MNEPSVSDQIYKKTAAVYASYREGQGFFPKFLDVQAIYGN